VLPVTGAGAQLALVFVEQDVVSTSDYGGPCHAMTGQTLWMCLSELAANLNGWDVLLGFA
jgi:hypothetical protein